MRKRIGNENLTSFLHEDKQIIKKFLALGVVVQFVKLYRRCKSSLALFFVKTRKGTSSELTDLCKVPGWFCSASSSFVLLSPDGSSLCVRREKGAVWTRARQINQPADMRPFQKDNNGPEF